MASVTIDRDGVWCARAYLGRDAMGKVVRPYRRLPDARSRSEAKEMADEWEDGLRRGMLRNGGLLADVLDSYVSMRESSDSAPSSAKHWRWCVRKVRAFLPRAYAASVSTRELQDFETRLLAPARDGGGGLSRASVLSIHDFLHPAFATLVGEGIRPDNPMAGVVKPRPERHEDKSFCEWDMPLLVGKIRSVLDSGDPSTRNYAASVAAYVALATGMRVAECCALRRRDVRPHDLSIHVCGSVTEADGLRRRPVTKGRRSRTVSVTDDDMCQIMAIVRSQDSRIGGLGPDSPLVTTDGSIMRPSVVSGIFSKTARSIGLPPGSRFHELRHTHATWCLSHGVDLKTVSLRLGHADETTTLKSYAHALPGRDADAARTFRDAVDETVRTLTDA